MERLAQLDLAVRLTEAGRGEEARAYVRAGTGRATMEQVRALILSMRSEERELLRVRNERSGSTARSLITTLAIGGALLFTFLILIWWLDPRGPRAAQPGRGDDPREGDAHPKAHRREPHRRPVLERRRRDGCERGVPLDRRPRQKDVRARPPPAVRLHGSRVPGAGRELREGASRDRDLPSVPEGARAPRRNPRAGPVRRDEHRHGRKRAGARVLRRGPLRAQARRGGAQPVVRGGARRREGPRRVPLGRGARDPDPAVGAQPHRLPAGAAPARAREREGDRPRGPVREAGRAARAPRRRAARRVADLDGAAPPEPRRRWTSPSSRATSPSGSTKTRSAPDPRSTCARRPRSWGSGTGCASTRSCRTS